MGKAILTCLNNHRRIAARGNTMKAEFNIGDKVTFHPYEKKLPATVKEIQYGSPFLADDDRVFYKLSGPSVITITTGRSIVESVLYDNS